MSKSGKQRKGYVELIVGSHQILHGFDVDNKEIIEEVAVDTPAKKLVAIDRILSVSEKFILTTYAFGRIVYWEYEGGYEAIKEKLQQAKKL
ncbi:hypothetical protein [Algoriphagus sp.]|uniref:hypothetical protein n=1 Tax=Algoriphagus sp. TaxID=1872435 RepID=UPI003F6F8C92